MFVVPGYFQLCENERFSVSGSRCMSDVITSVHLYQYKTGADREHILGQPMLFECMGICVLSPAHESEMRGYLVYVLIVKYLLILFKSSHSILDWTALSWNLGRGRGIFETFLEGSVEHIIYRDYIVNRRFFIYCSLACSNHTGATADVPPKTFQTTVNREKVEQRKGSNINKNKLW